MGVDAMRDPMRDAVDHFRDHGYVVLPGWLSAEEMAPAMAEFSLVFPTAEEYHSGVDPERNARFTEGKFAGLDNFPYASVEWSLLNVSPSIVGLAEALLGSTDVRLYEAHNWAKYGGATEYEQPLHRDFINHTLVVPSVDPEFMDLEMFIYLTEITPECGPTYVVSTQHSTHVPIWPRDFYLSRDEYPELYAQEVAALGPAGTILVYRTDVLHRASSITDPTGARFVLKASFRVNNDFWIDRLDMTGNMGPNWKAFVRRATPRQLQLLGFPPPGHPYWTEQTWNDVCQRYHTADMSAFKPTT